MDKFVYAIEVFNNDGDFEGFWNGVDVTDAMEDAIFGETYDLVASTLNSHIAKAFIDRTGCTLGIQLHNYSRYERLKAKIQAMKTLEMAI